MFNAIAGRYDFLNRLLSLGQDMRWRARLKEHLPKGAKLSVLDLATGTADVLIMLANEEPRIERAIGIDLAEGMLNIGRSKVEAQNMQDKILLQHGDAQALPFLDNTFDCVTIAFGIRNMPDLRLALLEMYRVLKKDGRVLILELSKPADPVLFAGHWLYLHTIVPLTGALFSGNLKAYRYLTQTIGSFPYGERFCKILKQFGFINIGDHLLMGGAATIYVAEK